MYPRIKNVQPDSDNYTLTLLFDNGESGVFDVQPYLNKGIFKDLKNKRVFNSVKPFLGSVKWQGGQDFCPDMLYLESKKVK